MKELNLRNNFLRIIKKDQKRTFKSSFPSLINSYNSQNNTNLMNSSMNKIMDNNNNTTKILAKSSSEVILKGINSKYVLDIGKEKKNFPPHQKNQEELEEILFMLKTHYNSLIHIISENNNQIKDLEKNIQIKENKLEKMYFFEDFELPDEKLIVKDSVDEPKSLITKRINKLIKKKDKIHSNVENSNQDLKIFENLYNQEKNNLQEIKRDISRIKKKLTEKDKIIKLFETNLAENSHKTMHLNKFSHSLDKNISLAYEVIRNQENKSKELELRIKKKEKKVNKLKNIIQNIKYKNKTFYKGYIAQKYNEIESGNEREKSRIEKEKNIIEVIYCLYVIQKYFFEPNSFDKEGLKSSKEYINLKAKNFSIFENIKDLYNYSRF